LNGFLRGAGQLQHSIQQSPDYDYRPFSWRPTQFSSPAPSMAMYEDLAQIVAMVQVAVT
jgi:hypothetical protein